MQRVTWLGQVQVQVQHQLVLIRSLRLRLDKQEVVWDFFSLVHIVLL